MDDEGAEPTLEPAVPKPLLALLDTLAPIDEDFPPIPDPAPEPVDLDLSAPAHS